MSAVATEISVTQNFARPRTHEAKRSVVKSSQIGAATLALSVDAFLRSVNAMLDQFERRADAAVADMESESCQTLGDFEGQWNELQAWLKAQARRALAAGKAAVLATQIWGLRPIAERQYLRDDLTADLALDLDRAHQRIERAIPNASSESGAYLRRLRDTCESLSLRILSL